MKIGSLEIQKFPQNVKKKFACCFSMKMKQICIWPVSDELFLNVCLNFAIHKELRKTSHSSWQENEADLYLVWILQTWFNLILLKFGMQKYGVGLGHNRQ